MKKSFILYKDNYELVKSLSDENAGKLFKKIYDYENGEDNNYGELIDLVFLTIKKGLDENSLKYEETCKKNKENVMKRWNNKNTNVYDRIPPNTKHTDTDTDTDTDTELSKDNIKKKINKKETEFDLILNSIPNNELKTSLIDFMKMRKTIKKPMTSRALELIIKDLEKLSNDDNDKVKIINQSIANSWQGVFPLKNDGVKDRKAVVYEQI